MSGFTPSSTVVEERPAKLVPPDLFEPRARVHKVTVRDPKLDTTRMLWALVPGFAISDIRSIEELTRTYVRFIDQHLVPSSFHDDGGACRPPAGVD